MERSAGSTIVHPAALLGMFQTAFRGCADATAYAIDVVSGALQRQFGHAEPEACVRYLNVSRVTQRRLISFVYSVGWAMVNAIAAHML